MFELISPMQYQIENSFHIKVPALFRTDFATIPRVFWSIVASDDKGILEASILHDYLYSTKNCGYTRKAADLLLLSGMDYIDKFNWFTKYLVYFSVRIFGRLWWVE